MLPPLPLTAVLELQAERVTTVISAKREVERDMRERIMGMTLPLARSAPRAFAPRGRALPVRKAGAIGTDRHPMAGRHGNLWSGDRFVRFGPRHQGCRTASQEASASCCLIRSLTNAMNSRTPFGAGLQAGAVHGVISPIV